MPYRVQSIKSLYDEADGGNFDAVIADFLNDAENDGWILISTVGVHDAQFIEETEDVRGFWQKASAMLILHKPEKKKSGGAVGFQ